MPIYFIQSQSIQNGGIELPGDLSHHLRDVLRCQPGEIIQLVDENRIRYRASLDRIAAGQVLATIFHKEDPPLQPAYAMTLAQSILKGDKMDWVIQKATELGVSAIIPVVTERTIVRPRTDRESQQRDRWHKIAKEAAQQCGRVDIPDIRPVVSLDELLANPPKDALKLVPWEAEQSMSLKSALDHLREQKLVTVLIGPEGGFSPREIEKAHKGGWTSVSLGPRILRAETAGLAVLAILDHELNQAR